VRVRCVLDRQYGTDGVLIKLAGETASEFAPVSISDRAFSPFTSLASFVHARLNNLWIGGSPNYLKDSIQALTAIVENGLGTSSLVTMNWRFTRPNTWVHFDAEEPICFF